MNKIDEKALNNQKICFGQINDLKQYCKKRFDNSNGLALIASCFNYGVMIGKRQERAKRKKCDIK